MSRPAPPVDARRSALLVIDMQRYFASICAPIIATTRKAVDAAHGAGLPVLFTQHGHRDPDRDGGMLGCWWGDLILDGSADHALLPDLGRENDDRVVPKRRYSAFFDTDLEQTLRGLGVEDLAVAGVMTNLCVETTARDAFVRDFRVRVLMDATATASEEMLLGSLVNLAFGFAHVQAVEEWVAQVAQVE
jgi:nicotinamidase-related amidase